MLNLHGRIIVAPRGNITLDLQRRILVAPRDNIILDLHERILVAPHGNSMSILHRRILDAPQGNTWPIDSHQRILSSRKSDTNKVHLKPPLKGLRVSSGGTNTYKSFPNGCDIYQALRLSVKSW